MREILFRGKRVDNGEWVHGFYFESLADDMKHCYIKYETWDEGFVTYEVIPETVNQFTGLCDKNGNKIFEGDIVCTRHKDSEICSLGDVQFECGTFGIEWTVNKKNKWLVGVWGQRHNLRRFDDGIGDDIVVIGNIHDNPKLLGE